MNMKKVLFVTTSDLSGSSGHNVATKEMVTAFARNNALDVSVTCPAPLDNMPQKINESVSDFYFIRPQIDKSISMHFKTQLSIFPKIISLLNKKKFDLLVIRHAPVMIAPTIVSRIFGVPYVLLARGLSHERLRFSPLLKKVFWLNVRMAEDVYCAYNEVIDRVKDIRASSQSSPVLFTNAVDPNVFVPQNLAGERQDTSVPYTESEFVVGFVGSLKQRHKLEVLVHALIQLPDEVHLLIVGDGPRRDSLEQLVSHLELNQRVTFTGFIQHEQVAKYIAACDVMYGVTDPENPSNPIKCYESLASARPIITDKSPEFEFVDDIGAGITIEEVTVDEIVIALHEFMSMSRDERLKMGKRGRKYILKNHTWGALVNHVVERNL